MPLSKKKVVIFSGAGISAESGLRTFRDSDGLWEGYRVEEVATPDAWRRDPGLVLDFYNQRRRACLKAEPNAAHIAIARLQDFFDVHVITQNVDDLHERGGAVRVLHLHGELRKSRSTADENLVYNIEGSELALGDRCEKGSQLRPHIVWFGEAVPAMDEAISIVEKSDALIVVGSSLVVYPAASLIGYLAPSAKLFVVDPKRPASLDFESFHHAEFLEMTAVKGVPLVVERLIASFA